MKHASPRRLAIILALALLLPTVLAACRNDPSSPDETTGSYSTSADDPGTAEAPTEAPTDPTAPPDNDPDKEEETVYPLTGPNAASIMYADTMKNEVQVYFADQVTRDVAVENTNMKMLLGTLTDGQKQVLSLQNKKGGTYLSNTMDVYIRTNDGRTLYASNSPTAARLNIYRYGYYYYNAHILDQIFAESAYVKEMDLKANSLPRRGIKSDIEFVDVEEGCAFRVTSTRDPYVGYESLKYPAHMYNAVEIVMRVEKASTADLFLGVGDHLWANSDQRVSFTVHPGETFCTYVVPISGVPDYNGTINSIRLDVGSAVDELIEIQSFRLVQLDSTTPSISLDRTLHTYSDKLTQETHLVTTAATDNLAAYGMTTELSADRVTAIIAKDQNGTHTTLDGVDFNTLAYIGFAIKDVGVFGYIQPIEYGGSVTVTLADGVYTINQEVTLNAGTSLEANTHLYMATGIYTDTNTDFDAFLTAAENERNPLEITITDERDAGRFLGYNALRGAYEISLNGTPGFQYNYENYVRRTVSLSVKGDRTDRSIYLYTVAESGETLESAVVLDANNRLLPIPVEVCKNFGHEKEEPVFVPNDDRWGEAYFPFVIEAGKDTELSIVNLYYDWGNFPLKQISSISFSAPYYHLSTGATETNCIANYFISFMSNNLLPDFRPMSQRFWVSQPQHTAGGALNFLSYRDTQGSFSALRHTSDEIKAYGPTYADIEMSFASYDDKLEVTLDHIEMPQTDENRAYYTYTITVKEDIEIRDFKNDVTLFTMSSTNTNYQKLGYLDETNTPAVTATSTTDTIRYITLGKESPYVDLFVGDPSVHEDGYTNLAVLVKSYKVQINGQSYDGHIILRESYKGGQNYTELTLDLAGVTLAAGDTMTFEMILMPWGEGQDTGISETDDIVRRVRMDSCIDPFRIEAATGTVIDHSFLPQITAAGGTAEFTLSGGYAPAVFYTGLRENRDQVRPVTVRVYGFDAVGVPVVEEYVDGAWVPYSLTGEYCYDGYMVHYEGDGTYSYSFNVDMKDATPRTFRVKLNTDETIFADMPLRPGDQPSTDTPEGPVVDGIAYSTSCINFLSTMSFDSIRKDLSGTLYQEKDGQASAYISDHPITLDDSWQYIQIRGWAGGKNTIVSYGYRINDGELVTDPSFTVKAEQGVLDAGGQSRFTINVPLEDRSETMLLRFYVVYENGESEEMIRFWVKGAA